MNKLILSENSSTAILFNPETLETRVNNSISNNVDCWYIANEDLEVTYQDEMKIAKKDNIILKMYPNDNIKRLIIIDNDDLTNFTVEMEKRRMELRSKNDCSEKVYCGSIHN